MTREILELARMRNLVHGRLVRELRVGAGLTLAEVARDVGVSPSTVFYWEQGRSIPRGEAALRYARLIRELEALARR